MSALPLPSRPDLDQLKRQAKELLVAWKAAPADPTRPPRLRDAQREIAQRYGFASWDALRAHVDAIAGGSDKTAPRRRGLNYDDPIPDVTPWAGPITREVAARLAGQGVTGLKVDASTPAAGLVHLAEVPSLQRLDVSGRDDLVDADLQFLERMPWLTAISLASCSRIGDGAVAHLRAHQALEQVNLQWTATGDEALASLAGKPALQRLVIGGRTTDAGVARLRDYPALAAPGAFDTFLSISSARTLTDDALGHIGNLKGVAALDVHMSVFGSPHYTARGVAHLAGMTALEALNFHGVLATDAVLSEIAAIPRLKGLHCQDIVSGDDGFVALGRRTTLEGIAARVCARLTDRGFAAIARLPRLRSLGIGGPRLADAGWAPIADAQALVDVGPTLSRDGAFAHIARIPNLERLSNMYNRATTDAATRCFRHHATLVHYHAFGTQITDESLRILADLPRLETLEFENCAGITDEGLRELARLPRLRRVSAWSCLRVTGTWLAAMPHGVEAKSEAGPPGQVEGYRAETLLDYPDLAVPEEMSRVDGASGAPGLLGTLRPFGVRAACEPDGLRLSLDPEVDPRWVGAVTEQAFSAPLRLELVVKPITALRLVLGGHNRFLAFGEDGAVVDAAPWFMKSEAQRGRSHPSANAVRIAPDEWARLTLEVGERERRFFVNGELRHTWDGDFAGVRSRVGIGLQRSGVLMIREFTIEPR
jgi:hypothetical protein